MLRVRDERTARRLGLEALAGRVGRARDGEVIRSVLRAKISGACDPARGFRARFDGAKLLTLNELLRLNPMARHRYRSAWHRAAHDAVLLIAPRARLSGPLAVSISRRGARLVDNDGLAAALKFAIDGFRSCGLIADDDPSVVTEIRLFQEKGSPSVEVAFEPILLSLSHPRTNGVNPPKGSRESSTTRESTLIPALTGQSTEGLAPGLELG